MATEINKILYKELDTFEPFNEQEACDQSLIKLYLSMFPDLYDRSNQLAHITASAWIYNQTYDKVLLVYHHIYQSWSWCGGHADGNHNLKMKAMQEAKEETGIHDLYALHEGIFAVDVLPVVTHIKKEHYVSAHVHLNFTYLFIGNDTNVLNHEQNENAGACWMPIQDIVANVNEEHMKRVYKKLMKKAKIIIPQSINKTRQT